METILFDTDYLIDFLRGKSSSRNIIIEALSQNRAYICILSVYELYAGMKPGEEEVTENCIGAFVIEPITLEISKKAGIMRYNYRQKGITLSIVDCIIAETARSNHHLVATMNKKHYPGIKFYL
jgi:predicted nucleic acid-binding protein